MKITVITVAFNAAHTIADALRSVAEQTHADIEHIVIDGGSKDGTLAIIEEYRAGLATVVSEPDRGIYDAMNKGLGLATGDVVGFLNADDIYVDACVLERIAKHMVAADLDALYGDAQFVRPDALNRPVRNYRSAHFRPDRIAWGWMPAHPTLFLKRSLFDHFGFFRTNYRIAGDFELIARIFQAGQLRYQYLPEVLVRMRTGGVSTGGLRSTIRLNQEVMRACRENGISTNWLKLLSKYPLKLMEFLPGR